MDSRKYTFLEIERMRRTLRTKYPFIICTFNGTRSQDNIEQEHANDRRIEDELRTYILAGISPEELEANIDKQATIEKRCNG